MSQFLENRMAFEVKFQMQQFNQIKWFNILTSIAYGSTKQILIILQMKVLWCNTLTVKALTLSLGKYTTDLTKLSIISLNINLYTDFAISCFAQGFLRWEWLNESITNVHCAIKKNVEFFFPLNFSPFLLIG